MIADNVKKIIPKQIKDLIHYILDLFKYLKVCNNYKKYTNTYNIITDDEMIEKIVANKLSLCRFGDGEFRWMLNISHKSFEVYTDAMASRLKEVLQSNDNNIMIAIPRGINDISYCSFRPKMFWGTFFGTYMNRIAPYLSVDTIYGDTEISRPYIDYKDKTNSKHRFDLVKKIWDNRELVIIEGEKTKLGVGNDLFSNVKNIKRILCPNSNAFKYYDVILEKAVLNASEDSLFLLALGPTATILAYDLACKGYQAIDIGHVDIEYEWYLRGAKSKETIDGKSMSEGCAFDFTGYIENDTEYLNSIVDRVHPHDDRN